MSTDERLERLLTEVLDARTPARPPDRLEPETLRALRHVRRRPRWLALIKEPPMRLTSGLAVGSPAARVATIAVATLLISLMVAGAGVAGSRLLAADGTIVVDQSGGGTVKTIGEAVARAEDGDTILVKTGTYDESVTVTKDVTIRGDGDRADVIVELSAEGSTMTSARSPSPRMVTSFASTIDSSYVPGLTRIVSPSSAIATASVMVVVVPLPLWSTTMVPSAASSRLPAMPAPATMRAMSIVATMMAAIRAVGDPAARLDEMRMGGSLR